MRKPCASCRTSSQAPVPNTACEVESWVEIGDGIGGFPSATLGAGDGFGSGLTFLDPEPLATVFSPPRLAVGQWLSDGGGADTG